SGLHRAHTGRTTGTDKAARLKAASTRARAASARDPLPAPARETARGARRRETRRAPSEAERRWAGRHETCQILTTRSSGREGAKVTPAGQCPLTVEICHCSKSAKMADLCEVSRVYQQFKEGGPPRRPQDAS